MHSVQTNTKKFTCLEAHCVCQVIAIPENGKFRIYVAWEWENAAEKGIFGFTKSKDLHREINTANIVETMNWGIDIGNTGEEKKIFKSLF